MSSVIDTFIAPPCEAPIEILYQDDALLVINKPSGLLSLSGKNPQNWDSVHYRLVQQFAGCTLVHRLDFGTSGLMLVGLNKTITAALSQQFSQRSVDKTYHALLCGYLPENSGIIDAPIAKDPAHFPLMRIDATVGKPAQSHFEVEQRSLYPLGSGVTIPVTRVKLSPLTGRTHQLRIHCQFLGYPIVGCDLYGGRLDSEGESHPRLMLHASSLSFHHPLTGDLMRIYSPLPF
ncbi:tRNA pseudouridine32 synthase / 23S rRNA pseudouridine746 synthase [Rosenbergiella nectarea]|uniref:tRNA pseudouridine32 synthase / 23S rRNA pseudouridine746 synthase n=1 Tax=Rosenbergiella nectarea TaxID=988801 RepID=A0A1H9JB76_9GAMM|nr:RluA family pseudouridine synthase [Rosenbergiella nectarea]SEQ84271.1 tRNA pseudouridine32 synthase / 23S rRNA pseudouridine746 synthase [Rosenbergiella nectarea]